MYIYIYMYKYIKLILVEDGIATWRRAWKPTPVFLPGGFPWTEEPVRVQSMGLQRVGHDLVTAHTQHI